MDLHPVVKPKRIGVRERSKQERQDRIMMAARKLFAEHGYDATTLREVAKLAGLGLGTLFNYISDKRDLIYLVLNQEVSMVTDASLAAPRPWQSFNEKILSMVEHYYRLFGSEPILSRILLSEVLQHTPGFHLAEQIAIRHRLIRGMEEVVAGAQASGEISSTESPELIARHIFFSYSAALRWWLASSEQPKWRAGMRDFAEILRLQTMGLGLQPGGNEKGPTLAATAQERANGVSRLANGGTTARGPTSGRTHPLRKA